MKKASAEEKFATVGKAKRQKKRKGGQEEVGVSFEKIERGRKDFFSCAESKVKKTKGKMKNGRCSEKTAHTLIKLESKILGAENI